MKNRFLPLGLITAFFGLSLLFFSALSLAGQPGNPDLKKIDGSRWESIRANQQTGLVNQQDVINAQQQAEALRVKSASGGMGLNWLSAGPDNYPGSVFSVLFDKTDPTGNTIIAGSTSGGIWKSTNLGLTWIQMAVENNIVPRVSSLVQTYNGTIFAATGITTCETVETAGTGIYRSENGGAFTVLSATHNNPDFYAVTKLVADQNSGRIFAATSGDALDKGGLLYSDNAGIDWIKVKSGYTMDVCVGSDGTVILATQDTAYMVPDGNFSNAWDTLTTGALNALPASGIGWMVFGIAPSDPNIMYASLANTSGKLLGIYRSSDHGGTWSLIFPNNPTFEPFNGFGCYSNTIAVFPNDPYKLYLGGTNMWYGEQIQTTGFYNWEQVSFGNLGNILNPYYAPSYHHCYEFRPNNFNQLVMATDGGVTVATNGASGVTYQTSNKNLQTSQMNALSFSSQKSYVMGGGERIGTQVLGYFCPTYVSLPSDGFPVYPGNGGTCEWSNIDSRIAVATAANVTPSIYRQDFTDLYNYNNFKGPINAVDAAYVPMRLWESFTFTQTHDSVWVYARSKTIPADTTLMVPSSSNKIPFPYRTTQPIEIGDSLNVADPIASRFIVFGDSLGTRGIYMTKDMLKFDKEPEYFALFEDQVYDDAVTALNVSADLNTVWAGTKAGRLIRITGLVNAYDSATANISSSQCVLVDSVFTNTPFAGRTVTSISINPKHSNLVLVTLGNYGNQDYVYYTLNGNDPSPLFISVHGNLPQAPVYTGLIVLTEDGSNNMALLGTDLGVFSTINLNSATPLWEADAQNIGDVLVTDIRQQVMHDYHILNYGVIYLSTYGRGMWMDTSYYAPVGIDPIQGKVTSNESLTLNPNPVKDNLHVSYVNANSGILNVSVYDLTGRLLINTPLGTQPKGIINTTINLTSLSHGTYIVKVGNGSGKIVKL
jgi:hypothetical protein